MEEMPKKRLMPKKADFRMRAHCNPLSTPTFDYPLSWEHIDWSELFRDSEDFYCNSKIHLAPGHPFPFLSEPLVDAEPSIDIVDIGCGFGGLLFALGPAFPEMKVLGMEIRDKVTNYVAQKIWASRKENPGQVIPKQFMNIGVVRANAMMHIEQFFPENSISKLFFCFPDPHFKKSHHRRRIISKKLIVSYAKILKPGGRIYTITDVKQLHDWHVTQFSESPFFQQVIQAEADEDICVQLMRDTTEEGKKVERNQGQKYYAVFQLEENA